MAEYLTNTTDLTKVASAIREKGGTSASLVYPDGFVSAIQAIQTGTELQIIVTVESGATVTATKGSLSISGISVDGTCTLVVPEAGTWSVSAMLNGQTSNTQIVSVVDSYAVELPFFSVSSTLNNNEWSVIKSVSDAGQGANYWSIGDRKAITLNGTVGHLTLSNYTTYAFIIGFNHNSGLEGSNRIHFQLAKTALSGGKDVALCDSNYNSQVSATGYFSMNSSGTNSGGWNSSQMRTKICGTSLSSYSGTTSYSLTLSFISSTLNNNEWSVIKSVSDAGQGENYWSIGDRKAVTLNGTVGHLTLSNYTTYAFIIGFNHNASVEGTNRIHFQLAKTALSGGKDVALCDSKYNSQASATGYFSMNSGATNSGGWELSQMRIKICGTSLSSYSGTIIAVIPAALRAVLKSVTKYTDNIGNRTDASAVTSTTDYFFLLSEYEVFGKISRGNKNESSKQAQYSYYKAGNSKVKYKHSATSTAVYWWLRNPVRSSNSEFVYVYTGGEVASGYAYACKGFAPGFCV